MNWWHDFNLANTGRKAMTKQKADAAQARQAARDKTVELQNRLLTGQVNEMATGTRCKNCRATFDPPAGPARTAQGEPAECHRLVSHSNL